MQNHKKVISFTRQAKPENWTFWDFGTLANNPIEGWYQTLADEARFLFDGVLKNIRKTENHLQWSGFRRFLKGKYKSERIWELGFYAEGRQYRILGLFGDQRKQVILLMGCYHKQQVYTPPDALDTAYKRAKDVHEGRAILRERKIEMDF